MEPGCPAAGVREADDGAAMPEIALGSVAGPCCRVARCRTTRWTLHRSVAIVVPPGSPTRVAGRKASASSDARALWLLVSSAPTVLRGAAGLLWQNATMTRKEPNMLCYSCAAQGGDQPAIALCRKCGAGLCLEHLRETASHFASSQVLVDCQHDTWATNDYRSGAVGHLHVGDRP